MSRGLSGIFIGFLLLPSGPGLGGNVIEDVRLRLDLLLLLGGCSLCER